MNQNDNLTTGSLLTFNCEIISESGRIIAEKGKKVVVEDVLINPGFWGERTGQWYDEKIYGVKLKGYDGQWRLSSFVETATPHK